MKVVLAEKPSVAEAIANVLQADKKLDGYYEGNGYQVTWAFGHLIQLAPFDSYDESFKKWSLDPLPFMPDKFKLCLNEDSGVKKQFKIIEKLFKASTSIILAQDAAREGELIGRYILDYIGNLSQPLERLWISSLTKQAIEDGFKNLRPAEEFDNLAAAAKARSEADWLVGLNATRGYTTKYSNFSGVLSVGRVQTPVLSMIVERDYNSKNFKSSKFYQVVSQYRGVKFLHTGGKLPSIEEAKQIQNDCDNNLIKVTKVEGKNVTEKPPLLYDLTTLQRQMSANFGLTATETLATLQKLYESKFVTYPRTDSRYLTDDMYSDCPSIFSKLNSYDSRISTLDLNNLSKTKDIFNNAKVSDHHAVIPTGLIPSSLTADQEKIYKAIVTRFISSFSQNCIKKTTKVTGLIKSFEFEAKGVAIVQKGWRDIESPGKEENLPNFKEGEEGIQETLIAEGTTRPPALFNESSLLGMMETAGKDISDKEVRDSMKERGLGTPATRAGIIETLLKREYIKRDKKNIISTDKGKELIQIIKFEDLKSPELTGDWEHKLLQIEKGQLSSDIFMNDVRMYTKLVIDSITNDTSDTKVSGAAKITKPLGKCPACQSDVFNRGKVFLCSDETCDFKIFKNFLQVDLTNAQVSDLITKGHTDTIDGFKNKEGKSFSAILEMKDKNIVLKFETGLGSCPVCKEGTVMGSSKACKCNQCDYFFWREIAGVSLSTDALECLFQSKKTAVINGFKSKKSDKSFSAALILEEDGKVSFSFPPKQRKWSGKKFKMR